MTGKGMLRTVIWTLAVGILLGSGQQETYGQKRSRKPIKKSSVAVSRSTQPASTRITPATLNSETAAELINELVGDFSSGWRQVEVIDGHQTDKSPFELLLESPVHNILRDRGLIKISRGPGGRAILNFTTLGERDFFSGSPPGWAIPQLPTAAMTSQGDYRKTLVVLTARKRLIGVKSINQTVSGTMEKIYWITYVWKYAKTEMGQAIDPKEREFESTRGFIYRNGRWDEGGGLSPDGKFEGIEIGVLPRNETDPYTFECGYGSWDRSNLNITRIPFKTTVSFMIPQGECWTTWLNMHLRHASGKMRFHPDGEVLMETLNYVGATAQLKPPTEEFADNRDWYAVRFKNLTNRTVTIRFDRGRWP